MRDFACASLCAGPRWLAPGLWLAVLSRFRSQAAHSATIWRAGARLWVMVVFAFLCLAAPAFGLMQGPATPDGAAGSAVLRPSAPPHHAGGEANLRLPDLSTERFLDNSIDGHSLLLIGILISLAGMVFGAASYLQLRAMPVHSSMRDISELIYMTCKSYMIQQGKFLMLLFAFIGAAMVMYFGFLIPTTDAAGLPTTGFETYKVGIVIAFSLVGMAGSYGVAWFGMRVNTFANSRTAFEALRGNPFPCYAIPLKAGMSIGMTLISVELLIMLGILLFAPADVAGACLIGFAIGESLGASALRIAGGIFTKIADIGSDLMKIAFGIKEDDARNPGVIADCVGDNAGDSVGPSADGFETYGVTGVALITFIMLAINEATAGSAEAAGRLQVQLLVWLFAMRIIMLIASALSYIINDAMARARYSAAAHMNFEKPLTSLVILTSVVSIALTFAASWLLIPEMAGDDTWWWKLSLIITCGTAAGAIIPELVKVFTSTNSRHVREVVTASEQGGASLNILSGLVAGNFAAFWLGLVIVVLMAIAYAVSLSFPAAPGAAGGTIMMAPAVFAFGLVAFGFLGMGPVTIAVDSYGPVTDNAQSVYELSTIESIPGISDDIQANFGFRPKFEEAKQFLEENDGAGNTFKATAKPVLIGTAVVGATTMIFSIIVALTHGLEEQYLNRLSLMHPPFLLGLITGGAVIYWFTGSSIQAVSTGAYRAVEFIKANINLSSTARASAEDSQRVVTICTQYAQRGMFNIFLGVFFATLAFAFVESYFFIGYLVSIALFGLYQANFMANAGGAWDNAKKIVETELKQKGTALHAATVVGDTVGDPFKDTSSVAMNPIIKFTTLFGLLAVELAVSMKIGGEGHTTLTTILACAFGVASLFFVWRSFYGMQIGSRAEPVAV